MQTATIWLELDSTLKNNVRKSGVTPAQAAILWQMFGKEITGQTDRTNPFHHIVIEGEQGTSDAEEYSRLAHIYGGGKDSVLKAVFPGNNPKLPQTFKEIGLSETEQPEPKSGKKHTIEPLASLPKGDLTDEERLQAASATHPLQETVVSQKAKIEDQQKQIDELRAMVEKLAKPAETEPPKSEEHHE